MSICWGTAVDYAKAMQWYRQAADLNYVSAMNDVGLLYHDGHGVAQDDAEAYKWFQKAATLGLADGMYDVAWANENGRGTAQNMAQARYWYQKAADAGDDDAKAHLAKLDADTTPAKANPLDPSAAPAAIDPAKLAGTWRMSKGQETVTLVFNSDGSCSSAVIVHPGDGDASKSVEDKITIVSLDDKHLVISPEASGHTLTLERVQP